MGKRLSCGEREAGSAVSGLPSAWSGWRGRLATAALGLAVLGCGIVGCSSGSGGGGTPPPQPPTANAGGVYVVTPGTAVNFSSAGSTDPQGEVLTFAWVFGDGTTGTGATVSHLYAQPGQYNATLTVTDTSGLSTTATALVHVGEYPVANLGGPYTVSVGVPVTFNGGASSDPLGEPLTYAWTFGDGSTGSGVTVQHTYEVAGSYTLTLKVTNTAGFANSASTTFTVPPTLVIGGPYSGRPGLPLQFTSSASEPGRVTTYTYAWQFGDGGTSNVENPQHTYSAAGTYNVSVTATGGYGESATAKTTATITVSTIGPAFSGVLQSGTVPVVAARVYLLAANTTGYGQASVSLLSGTGASDAVGSYVVTDGGGAFTFPAGYNCAAQEQVYAYAAGGSISGNTNASATLMTALGACGYLGTGTEIVVNEATTVAAAFALSGYMTSPVSVSSPSTAQALTGIGNAFLNAGSLVSAASGQALLTTVSGGTAPQAKINTLANDLYGCLSSAGAGSSGCTTLFGEALSGGTTGAAPADTATAALNIAHNQGANAEGLYVLHQGGAFQPTLIAAPHDFAMPVTFGGLEDTDALAVDAAGDVWVLQYENGSYLTELSSNGIVLANVNTNCMVGANLSSPGAIAIAPQGNVFLLTTSNVPYTYTEPDGTVDEDEYEASEYCVASSAGTMLSGAGGYALGGDENANLTLYSLAVDANGNAWIPSTTLVEANAAGGTLASYPVSDSVQGGGAAIDGKSDVWFTAPEDNSIVEVGPSGNLISTASGATGGGLSVPSAIALDNAGGVWAINTHNNSLYYGMSISKIAANGTPAAGSPFDGGDLNIPYSLAVDGSGNVWVANTYAFEPSGSYISVIELKPGGSEAMSISYGGGLNQNMGSPQALALDSAGDVWMANGGSVTVAEFIGASTPVVTPLSANLAAPYGTPASRP